MILLLKKIKLFENFTDQELEKIRNVCQGASVKGGEVIFQEGDPGDKCYMILKGEVRISKFIPNIGEEALAILREGAYFGEMALIDNFPRSAHAIANTDASLITLKKADLETIFITDRELGFKFLWTFARTLSKRLRDMNDKMAGFLAMAGGF
jgi:CRP/FNR family cyclic AMP-dependent transcriptional regulator